MTIREVAQKFEVSPRTLRYYEEIGILSPERTDNLQRHYYKKDIARLRLILRGKKFGFTLDEIKEMVTLFDSDRTGEKQLERTIAYGEAKIKEVDDQIDELKALKADMEMFKSLFEDELKKIRHSR
ncbi:DNA-binding transcriptional regulator, MerR family [Salipaludibacillus aurantiacus]|uniref:DNA-binding transcriptional regulator, MerR family n=2 Tax=Bacillaceae TaxID=186817 RepID=A0A1H9WA25_9BACI|nr:DNA-binding transcriptional regulator, MerR family [Salipaludibacillus aurantiacus]